LTAKRVIPARRASLTSAPLPTASRIRVAVTLSERRIIGRSSERSMLFSARAPARRR
jgi:hypothetical protein